MRQVTHNANVREKKIINTFGFQLRRPVGVQLLQVQELRRGGMQLPQQQQQQQPSTRDNIRGVL